MPKKCNLPKICPNLPKIDPNLPKTYKLGVPVWCIFFFSPKEQLFWTYIPGGLIFSDKFRNFTSNLLISGGSKGKGPYY